ncbi:MAG: SURF1 family protein [Sphingomonas sp.]|nr:SURF1 family protein [Sphingomonas sp.]
MNRLPLIPTIIVSLAVAAMVALGIWQLQRADEKAVVLKTLAANQARPPIAFPSIPIGDHLLFRKASAFCLSVTGWTTQSGRDAQGNSGWRKIAHCRTGAEGPGFQVQLGIGSDPNANPAWKGGKVSGFIGYAPNANPLIVSMLGGGGPRTLMLIADSPPSGLRANAGPDLSAVPNNHLAYAVQWFIFAALALIIYAVALRRRVLAPRTPAK